MLSTVGVIIDIVVISGLIISAFIGLKKGLFKSVLSLFSWGFCISVAMLTAKYVAGWLNAIYDFSGLIGNKIASSLANDNSFFALPINTYEAGGKDALIAAIPSNVSNFLTEVIKIVFSTSNVDMKSSDSIGSVVGAGLGHICFVVVTGIIIFIILKIAVFSLSRLFKNLEQTKVIGGLNKILGLTLGLVRAVLIIFIVNCVLVGISYVPFMKKIIKPVIHDNTKVERLIYNTTDSIFTKYVVEGDILTTWINKLWTKK